MFLWGNYAWIAWKFWFWWFEANILIGILLSRGVLYQLTKRKEISIWILCFSLLAISHYWLKEYLDYGTLPFFFVLWWRLAKNKTWGIFFWIPILLNSNYNLAFYTKYLSFWFWGEWMTAIQCCYFINHLPYFNCIFRSFGKRKPDTFREKSNQSHHPLTFKTLSFTLWNP